MSGLDISPAMVARAGEKLGDADDDERFVVASRA